jgi:hypothetical protein
VVLWLAGAAGTILLPWRSDRRFAFGAAAYALGSFLAVCLPGWFWRHYYLLLLPSLVIGAATIMERIEDHPAASRRAGACVYASVIFAATLALQVVFYVSRAPTSLSGPRYSARMAWARDQGRRVGAVTDPGDTVCVWGMDVGIYYYSQRRSASRYTLSAPLRQDSPAARQRRARFIEDLERHRPRIIVLTQDPIPELDRFVGEHGYVAVGADGSRMFVLCDPDRPIAQLDWTWTADD